MLPGSRRKRQACAPRSLALEAGSDLSNSLGCPQPRKELRLQRGFLRDAEEPRGELSLAWTCEDMRGDDCHTQLVPQTPASQLCPKLDSPGAGRGGLRCHPSVFSGE